MTASILPTIQAVNKLFLAGPFGSGKTTLALERIRWLLRRERTRGDDILVLTPQRTLAEPFTKALRGGDGPAGPPVRVTTFAGLARQAVELYWPLLAGVAGFTDPKREPTFLNLETSQYHMAQLVDEAIARGDFDSIRIQRNRIISQVLDNLNKTALQGFTIDEAYGRLELAVPLGEQRTGRLNALRAAQGISQAFRQLCLEQTLIDFSMQVELFNRHVLTNDWSRTHLFRSHRHLIFDNLEEDTISAHRLVQQWLPHLESALVIADDEAGFRIFLGAHPDGVAAVAQACGERLALSASHVMEPSLIHLTERIDQSLNLGGHPSTSSGQASGQASGQVGRGAEEADTQFTIHHSQPTIHNPLIIPNTGFRFYPQMIRWAVGEIRRLVQDEGVPAGEIVVLAPFVSDALRFSLQTGLAEADIALTTHRPSRALEAEPSARTLLTLAALAHPHWGLRPPPADVTLALTLAVEDLDPVRAHLLTRIVYPERRATIELGRFGALEPGMQGRITFVIGEAYDRLRDWLYAYRATPAIAPLDQFFARLFGEVLSQPGFGFHDDRDAARVASQLVESARNFRWAMEGAHSAERRPSTNNAQSPISSLQSPSVFDLGREYVQLVQSGALGALYVPGWRVAEDAIFLAPAYTFLMRNRPVSVQFWLDIGAGGWWERLYQPLTHPYVLSQAWPPGQPWSDFDEYNTRQRILHRLLLGLIRRTRQRIYLGISDYSESGFEQRGPLLTLINRLMVER
jgi:hypothetical protein